MTFKVSLQKNINRKLQFSNFELNGVTKPILYYIKNFLHLKIAFIPYNYEILRIIYQRSICRSSTFNARELQ